MARVAQRVLQGGHNIPEPTVRQRYARSLQNFFKLYRPVVDRWKMYDNSDGPVPSLIAIGHEGEQDTILNAPVWEQIQRGFRHE